MHIPTFGRPSLETVCRIRKRERLVIAKRKGPPATEEQVTEALEGRTYAQAAHYLGYSCSGFTALLKIYGISTGRRLTNDDSRLIVALIDGDMSRAEVAEKFDVTEQTVSAHYHRMTGRYLPTARNKKKGMAFDSRAYRDPSMLTDKLRDVERKMRGCEKCRHEISGWGVKGCAAGAKLDEDGYCWQWKAR